jgi:hypothetical protein
VFHFPHIFWNHRQRVRGSALKEVHCESCDSEYVYHVTRKAKADGTSILFFGMAAARRRAHDEAMKKLQKKLAKAIEAVPCPACGWYQAAMIPMFKRKRLRWVKIIGLLSAATFVVLLLWTWATHAIFAGLPFPDWYDTLLVADVLAGGVGFTLLLGRAISNWNFDANAFDPEIRIQQARTRALLREEYFEVANREANPGEKSEVD